MSKIVVACQRGTRTEKSLTDLVEDTVGRLKSPLDVLYTSDEWDAYAGALRNIFYEIVEPVPHDGPGRKAKPKKLPHKDLKYAVVHKERKGGKVIKVTRKVVYGNEGEIMKMIEANPVSHAINTAFIERNNLTLREGNRRLTRKTSGFSKAARLLDCQLAVFLTHYHFVRPHGGLTLKTEGQKCIHRTPFMAAGLTDKIWSFEELLRYVPVN
ncbi:MAG: IS1 family transposase [Vulcanimicrobiota bacterium]